MPFLIDGHNLISALPDIDLDDPDDEAKLVEKLRRFSARTGKRCTVVFDGGLPGGFSRELSKGPVQVFFAAAQQSDADTLLRARIGKVRHPGGWTVVSSDREVQRAAEAQGMKALSSQDFAAQMGAALGEEAALKATDGADDKPAEEWLDPTEVEEWLRFFQDRRGG